MKTTTGPRCISYLRFSKPEQLKGDSLRRQLALTEEYVQENGMVLDESLTFQDKGISAFRGLHRIKGALGKFLELIEKGQIVAGSVLIIESLDRLTRQECLVALNLFTGIIMRGIDIVTLTDRTRYSEESLNTNPSELVMSLMIMCRAHEESAIKSKRLTAAWEQKRKTIGTEKLTKKCPQWLELNDERTEYYPIPDRSKVIESIYRMYLSGKGVALIVKELNRKADLKWTPKNGWRRSYIQKILRTRAVIGEFQPHKMIEGKRTPVGDVISSYFPRIVTEKLFYRVQEQLERNIHFGGKNGTVSNLFGGIARCGYCGSPMQLVDKGKPPKGAKYLVCDSARRGMGCKYQSVRYMEVEEQVLTFCKGLSIPDIVTDRHKENERLSYLHGELSSLKGQLRSVKGRIENLADTISDTSDKQVRRVLGEKLAHQLDSQHTLKQDETATAQEIERLSLSEQNLENRIEDLKGLLNLLQTTKDTTVRLRVRNELRNLIRAIKIYPVGMVRLTPETVKDGVAKVAGVYPDATGTHELKRLEREKMSRIGDRSDRQFVILFRTGAIRIITPAKENPLSLDLELNKGKRQTLVMKESGGFAVADSV